MIFLLEKDRKKKRKSSKLWHIFFKKKHKVYKIVRKMVKVSERVFYKTQLKKVIKESTARRKLVFIDRLLVNLKKDKLGEACELIEKRRATLFVRVSMNWKVIEAFEIEESLKDLEVLKCNIYQALRIANAKKKLIKRGRNANRSEHFSVNQAVYLPVLQF
jgi:hypothetical protein